MSTANYIVRALPAGGAPAYPGVSYICVDRESREVYLSAQNEKYITTQRERDGLTVRLERVRSK